MTGLAATATFLFTDIEGSTPLWDQHQDAMEGAIAAHNEMLRRLVTDHNGQVVKMTGDGVFAAFGDATDAVTSAVEAQRAFAETPFGEIGELRIRIGLHTGEGFERDSDYYGTAVNRAARIMAVAHGGQILCSEATNRLAKYESLDLGITSLPGLAEPEHIHQIVADRLKRDFPPLPAAGEALNNLPATLTDFVGRDTDMERVTTLLSSSRIVTVTGAVGVGKTRLALEVGSRQAPSFDDGVWLVDLSTITSPDGLVGAVATTLGVIDEPGRTLVEGVAAYLADRNLLLILDNCEQVRDAVQSAASDWLASAPGLRILATSRELLGIAGESVWPLAPLGQGDRTTDDAVRLFVTRAEAINPHFDVQAHLDDVSDLCDQLDGIPLAIELAAARVTALTPAQISDRLGDQQRILGRRGDEARHGSLENAIAWSYGQLDSEEQRLFEALSVFAGGFDLASAEALANAADVEELDVVDLLTSLVNKSLVVAETNGGEIRYRFLETLRQFALTRLVESGRGEPVRGAQADWALAHVGADRYYVESYTAEQWLAVTRERRNLEESLGWLVGSGNAADAAALAVGLTSVWIWLAYRDGLSWLGRVLEMSDLVAEDRVALMCSSAWLEWFSGRQAHARIVLEETERLAADGGFPFPTPGLAYLTAIHALNNEPELAVKYAEEATTRAAESAIAGALQGTDTMLAWAYISAGRLDRAEDVGRRMVAFARESGSPAMLVNAIMQLGVAIRSRHPEEALALFDEGLELAESAGARWWLSSLTLHRSYSLVALGDRAGALSGFVEATRLSHEASDLRAMASAVEAVASIAAELEQGRQATVLLAGAARLRDDLGAVAGLPIEVAHRERVKGRLESGLGGSFDEAWEIGYGLDADELAREVESVVNA